MPSSSVIATSLVFTKTAPALMPRPNIVICKKRAASAVLYSYHKSKYEHL